MLVWFFIYLLIFIYFILFYLDERAFMWIEIEICFSGLC